VLVKYSADQQSGQGKKDWVLMMEQKSRPLCIESARSGQHPFCFSCPFLKLHKVFFLTKMASRDKMVMQDCNRFVLKISGEASFISSFVSFKTFTL
jgi:hypothetical protein